MRGVCVCISVCMCTHELFLVAYIDMELAHTHTHISLRGALPRTHAWQSGAIWLCHGAGAGAARAAGRSRAQNTWTSWSSGLVRRSNHEPLHPWPRMLGMAPHAGTAPQNGDGATYGGWPCMPVHGRACPGMAAHAREWQRMAGDGRACRDASKQTSAATLWHSAPSNGASQCGRCGTVRPPMGPFP